MCLWTIATVECCIVVVQHLIQAMYLCFLFLIIIRTVSSPDSIPRGTMLSQYVLWPHVCLSLSLSEVVQLSTVIFKWFK